MDWNDLSHWAYCHFLNFNKGVAERFDNLCKESVDVIFLALNQKTKDKIIKDFIFKEIREVDSPKDLFLTLISINREDLIEKNNLKPTDFVDQDQPYPSWVINLETGEYEAPVKIPEAANKGEYYKWDEDEKTWVNAKDFSLVKKLKQHQKKSYQEERKVRLGECRKCEYKKNFVCTECGCLVFLKTALPNTECPAGKWKEMRLG
jgi:hypothetical protein